VRARTKIFGIVAALAMVTTIGSYATPNAASAASGPDRLPLTFTNNSGRDDAVYLYLTATDLSTGQLGYIDAGGGFTGWPAGSTPPTPAPDVSISGPGNGASTTLQLPSGYSGRIYYSLGKKLNFFLPPGGLVQPAPQAPADTNRDTLFDWSEFTYKDTGLWLNSSQVEMFAVPHTVTVTGGSGTRSSGTVVADGRDKVIKGLREAGWGDTIYTRSDGTVLRVLAPSMATEAGALSATYLDSYIDSAWHAYAGKTLTVVPFADQPDTKYLGRTAGDAMTFTNASGQQVAQFSKPSTMDVWRCAGALQAPNDLVVGPIARTLCAALNRGTLGTIDTQPSTDAGQFYRNDAANQYAKLVHANMADGRAYAFSFDDVGHFESIVSDGAPSSAAIVLNPFTGGGGGTPAETEPAAPAPATGNLLASDWHGKCIDVPGANFSDGIPLQVSRCDDTDAQRLTFVDGTLRSQNNQCVDVAWGATENGAPIQIANCSGNPAQQFVLAEAGDLVNPQANKCVDIKDWNGNDGAGLQLWECVGTVNQKWHKR